MPLFSYAQSIVPCDASAWNGVAALRNGIAIASQGEVGTLGAVITVRGQTFITCARHLVGATDVGDGVPVSVWMGHASSPPWQPLADLCVIPDKYQPGREVLYDSLDVAFLSVNCDARDVLGGTVQAGAAAPPPTRTALQYYGSRRGRVQVAFDAPWTESSHASAFDPADLNGLDTSCCGVIALTASGYDCNSYSGDSGSSLWTTDTQPACVGQLIGVSPTQPLGLIALYSMCFAKLGIPQYSFV